MSVEEEYWKPNEIWTGAQHFLFDFMCCERTQISLLSEFWYGTLWVVKDPKGFQSDSENSDQPA